ncbi:alpha/beta hydrolase [Actinopolymorpha alba]|uniref:alpha/beta hydrolase n=1 Tax=Actinopolymorpha alba TaxID=533267 RepID=UPI000370DA2C|nr:alpha/beta hydrolase family protein [Actinopolymorpha alba]
MTSPRRFEPPRTRSAGWDPTPTGFARRAHRPLGAIVERPMRAPFVAVLLLCLFMIAGLLSTGTARAGAEDASGERPPVPVQASNGARVVDEVRVAANLVDLTISSPALATTAKVRLLTPDGWENRRPGQRWPVLFLLHGCCASYLSWTRSTDVASIPELRGVLVVMPEAGRAGFYSDWWNAGAGGPPAWETFHLTEVRQILERGYGASNHRVIAGLSMGGFGALSYAARNPGMFRAAASYSGVVDTRHTPGASDLALSIAASNVPDPLALWGDPDAQAGIWAAHNPVDLAARLRNLPVYLSCGNGEAGPFDPPDATSSLETLLESENRLLSERLTRLGARHLVTNFYGPGTHGWRYWERQLHRSLPMLLAALR